MLRVERSGATAIWTLDRPDAKNALSASMFDALTQAIDEAGRDRSIRAAIVTGADKTFSAGADLREARAIATAEDAARFSDLGESIFRAIENLPFPVIAAIPGVAFGGGAELATACDMRIADANARIAYKQVRMGVSTAWGTLPRLVAIVGHGGAMRLLATAHEIDAHEARALSLVDHVAPDGNALAVALTWASDIERGAPDAVRAMKRLVVESRRAAYETLRPLERSEFVASWISRDHVEAVDAYFERRAPVWASRAQKD